MLLRTLYSTLFTLIMPIIFVKLWWRSLKHHAYRERWKERVGLFDIKSPLENVIWIHAVSMGEAISAIPLIKRLRQINPKTKILITTMTPTGSERIQTLLGNEVEHYYLPYDVPWAIANFFRRVQPTVFIIIETELWPNIIYACARRNIPIIIANARLSERSVRRYRYFRKGMQKLLSQISFIATQSPKDSERYATIGASADKIEYLGNLKFDLKIAPEVIAIGNKLRQSIGKRPVWIAASTHEGEEAILLSAHQQILALQPDSLLIIVPRHPDRFESVYQLLKTSNLHIARRSKKESCHEAVQVYLADTMGELMSLYVASDVAFVGGSLVSVGGHNALEPAALSKPVLMGPYTQNCQQIFELLCAHGGAIQVKDAQSLAMQVHEWFEDKQQAQQTGCQANQIVAQNQGACDRLIKHIHRLAFQPSTG